MPDQISDKEFIENEPEEVQSLDKADAPEPEPAEDGTVEVDLPSIDDLLDGEDETKEDTKEDEEESDEPKPLGTLSFKEIKEKFKSEDGTDIFEAVPNLRRALILDQKFHSQFNSIEEVQEAAEKAEVYDFLNNHIMQGDATSLVNAINNENPKALEPFIKNFLPSVLESNPALFQDVIVLPIFNNLLNEVKDEARRKGNKNLWLAVKHVSNEINGTPNVPNRIPIKKADLKDDPERQKLNQERAAFNATKYTDFSEGINSEVDRSLERDIEKIIESADPNHVFTAFTKRHLRDDIFESIIEVMKNDRPHFISMGNLMKLAARSNYSPEAKTRVKSAILGRARKDLRIVAGKHLKEAVGAIKRTNGKVQTFSASGGRTAVTQPQRVTKVPPSSAVDYRNLSDDQILQGQLKIKK